MKIKVVFFFVSCDPIVSDAIREDILAPIDNSLDRCSMLMWFLLIKYFKCAQFTFLHFLSWNELIFHQTEIQWISIISF